MRVNVSAKIEVFPDRLVSAVNSPSGAINGAVISAASALLTAARPLIGQRFIGQHPGKQLRESGRIERISDTSPAYQVIFTHPAAIIHHQGSKPHDIGRAGQRLFRNGPGTVGRGGQTKFSAKGPVHHPGHAANPYLIRAAQSIGLRQSGALLRGSQLTPIVRTPKGL